MEDCMQESGSTSSGSSKGAPAPSAPRSGGDPVVRWLALGIFAVIILWLVGMLSAMMFGLLTPAKAPRTETEAQLLTLQVTVDSGKAPAQTYAKYIGVLIDSGQYGKAQQALNEALKTAKKDKSYLFAEQARLALAQKDYKGTVAAADQAMTTAQAELKAFEDENVRNNRRKEAGAVLATSFATAALAKAEALLGSKDYPNAIKAFDVYLKQSPTDSDILVQRALVKVQVGDKKGAEADYRTALKFIPDYQPALDGLKQIGAAR
jgi:tetratricopeptide (TPR) repeat protein